MTPSVRTVVLAAALATGQAAAGPMDEALRIVLTEHPEMAAREAQYRALQDSPRWAADLSLSLTEGRTDFGTSGGHRATVSVTIPLGRHPRRLDEARARTDLESARAAVKRRFLEDVQALRGTAAEVDMREEHRDFRRDQVAYYQEGVEEGEHEPDRLWSAAEHLQSAEHAYRAVLAEYESDLERVAREYGGGSWRSLRELLVEIAN